MSNNDDTTEQYLLFFVIRGGKISGDFEKSDSDSQNSTQFFDVLQKGSKYVHHCTKELQRWLQLSANCLALRFNQ